MMTRLGRRLGTSWLARLLRGRRLDRNPLRRGSDRAETVVLGALFLGIISNALPVINISPFWQMAISGAAILVAVVVNSRNPRGILYSLEEVPFILIPIVAVSALAAATVPAVASAQSIPVKNSASGSARDTATPQDGSDGPAAARLAPGRSLTGALRRVSLLPVCGPARAGGGGVIVAIHWRPTQAVSPAPAESQHRAP